MAAPSAPGHVGLLPTMNYDASRGLPRMEYRSPRVASDDGFALLAPPPKLTRGLVATVPGVRRRAAAPVALPPTMWRARPPLPCEITTILRPRSLPRDDSLPRIFRSIMVPSLDVGIGQRPQLPWLFRIRFCARTLRQAAPNLHFPRSKPAPPQFSADPTNGYVSTCDDAQMHILSVIATPGMEFPRAFKDKRATPSEVGGGRPLEPTPIERVRIPKCPQKEYCWEPPPIPEDRIGYRDLRRN